MFNKYLFLNPKNSSLYYSSLCGIIKLSRTLNEKLLYRALIVALSKLVSHLTYDEIIMQEFQPK
jgi:hypothetical protein